jgi:hypothetical protein
MSVLTDIAGAVEAELNAAPAGTFEPAFTAQRVYLPQYDLKDMADLHVTVVPKGVVVQSASRAVSQYDYSIDVAVQKKLLTGGTTDPAEIDPLMALVEQIADFFRQRRLSAYPSAAWVRTEHTHLYAQEHMSDLRQFTSVLTLTFRVMR